MIFNKPKYIDIKQNKVKKSSIFFFFQNGFIKFAKIIVSCQEIGQEQTINSLIINNINY